jgi:vancomycin resistance protein YoaR
VDRLRLTALAAVGVPLLLLLLVVAAWAVDLAVGGRQVARNVEVAGRDVGGLDEDALQRALHDLASELGTTPVAIVTEAGTLETTAGALGLDLDEQATAAAALDVGRDDPLVLRPFTWARSLFAGSDAPTSFAVDREQVAAAIAELEGPVRIEPVEPGITFDNGVVVTSPGVEGRGLDPADVAAALARVDEAPRGTLTIDVDLEPVPARFTDADARALADRVNAATADPLPVEVGGEPRELDGTALRPFVAAVPGPEGLTATLEAAGVLELLGGTFGDVGTPPEDATVGVSGGAVVITPGAPGTKCCDPSAVEALARVVDGDTGPARLELTTAAPARTAEYYSSLGISERIAGFTTNHAAGQPRVANIHRMADMVRGSVIAPGETFSLNATTGPRTTAKGFVAAPIILDASFAEDVGGGVSQFSTTLFNAAFFGGLEIYEYMAHGIYISRYPYGREATLSYPGPDLKIHNNTPYGVLVWPSYTDTSITVELYSTPYVQGEQTGQTVEQYDVACKRVTTERTRTWLGTGATEVDTFSAIYQDEEGVRCDGSRQEPDPTTTTTAPPPPPGAPPPGPAPPAGAPPPAAPPAGEGATSTSAPPTTGSGG